MSLDVLGVLLLTPFVMYDSRKSRRALLDPDTGRPVRWLPLDP